MGSTNCCWLYIIDSQQFKVLEEAAEEVGWFNTNSNTPATRLTRTALTNTLLHTWSTARRLTQCYSIVPCIIASVMCKQVAETVVFSLEKTAKMRYLCLRGRAPRSLLISGGARTIPSEKKAERRGLAESPWRKFPIPRVSFLSLHIASGAKVKFSSCSYIPTDDHV